MDKNKKFLLYGHGGSYNHGAEAIIRSTIKLIKKNYPDGYIILSTHFKEQDVEFGIDVHEYCERDMYYVELDKTSSEKGKYDKFIYKSAIDKIDKDTICMSVGGDNYCYDNWRRWKAIHERAVEVGAKSVLWSCSIEPSMLCDEMLDTLKFHILITARESITYNSLLKKGLKNVVLCSDVAFLLDKKEVKLPDNFIKGNTLGINLSPLIVRREERKGIIVQNILNVIDYVINKTNMNIAFIPHVVMPMDNDYELLSELYKYIDKKDRTCLISYKLNASEYKYIISQCRFGIFARTHATIAGYSSGVPILALGYSVKAKGIAFDLGCEDYVVPLDGFTEERTLEKRLIELIFNENNIRSILERSHELCRVNADKTISLLN
ncbi:polysaccharide pyruvyl transferase family protein [Sedimentibacter sp.]|uniref:polysaccharide pyruvyl transferase family protein n=1 Tax=Sedimentibacter sp. TaxID=1960295 RepID=UPI002897805D|nr:polysaccharide pyruvyl transferase family protein [Sedimentibacter sp.]